MLSCNIDNYLIKRRSERHVVIILTVDIITITFFTLSMYLIITVDLINIMILIMKVCSTYRVNACDLSRTF